jgi:hypothetical protein
VTFVMSIINTLLSSIISTFVVCTCDRHKAVTRAFLSVDQHLWGTDESSQLD